MLYEKIKAAKFAAMKTKDEVTKNILTIFQGDVTTFAKKSNKEIDNDMCLVILQKMKKSLDENLKYDVTDKELTLAEIEVLKQYLPQQLSKEQILFIIHQENLASLKDAFALFSKKYKGLYDSKIITEYFKGN